MLKSRSFIVEGTTVHRNGQAEKSIASNVDEKINSFLKECNGKYIDLKIDAKVNPGVGTDIAFITIVVEVDDLKKVAAEPIPSKKK